MLPDRRQVVCLGQLGQAVAEVADTRKNKFLQGSASREDYAQSREVVAKGQYLCLGDIFRRLDPFYLIAQLLNGVHQAPDVARNIVQQMNGGHLGPRLANTGSERERSEVRDGRGRVVRREALL